MSSVPIRRPVMLALACALAPCLAMAAPVDAAPPPSGEARASALQNWRDAKFGMFVHWGVYAVPAGVHDGKPVRHLGEWIMHHGRISKADYAKYAAVLAPDGYDPAAWVALAKEAGIRYMVVTAKHHDGFALFDSKVSAWDAVDATPRKRDLLMPLVEECRKQRMPLGFHYSQALDWWHPGGARFGEPWDASQHGSFDDYLARIAVPQIRELLANYGPVFCFFFDTPVEMNAQRAAAISAALPASTLTNDRLFGGSSGSYKSYENRLPDHPDPARPWELCLSCNGTWGFKSADQNWKSSAALLRTLIDTVSCGGNMLLNVGPDAKGRIPEPAAATLREIGAWLARNGEAIYGTDRSPYPAIPWAGGCTTRPLPDDETAIYPLLHQWPPTRELRLPGLSNPVLSARLLPDGPDLATVRQGNSWLLRLPAAPVSGIAVVKVVVKGRPVIESPAIINGDTNNPAARPGGLGFYWKQITADNSAGPLWSTDTVTSGGVTLTGQAWTPAASVAPEYDFDGNLTNDGRWAYVWDAENRLIRMTTTPTAANAGVPRQRLDFVYDSQGRRVSKTVSTSPDGTTWTLATDRRFLYDGWNLIAEYEGSAGVPPALTATYLWGPDLSGTMQGAGGVGGLLAVSLLSSVSQSSVYPAYDGNGNISAWISEVGTLLARMDYSPFGQLIARYKFTSDTILSRLPFGFSTKYTDAETGLLYYGHRYYDPVHGRWQSRDPIGESGGMNLYCFVGNGGIGKTDINGHYTLDSDLTNGPNQHEMRKIEESLSRVSRRLAQLQEQLKQAISYAETQTKAEKCHCCWRFLEKEFKNLSGVLFKIQINLTLPRELEIEQVEFDDDTLAQAQYPDPGSPIAATFLDPVIQLNVHPEYDWRKAKPSDLDTNLLHELSHIAVNTADTYEDRDYDSCWKKHHRWRFAYELDNLMTRDIADAYDILIRECQRVSGRADVNFLKE